jgi:hypothetical protein
VSEFLFVVTVHFLPFSTPRATMIHLMVDPNSASEFYSTNKGGNEKRQMNELFPAEQTSARKPSLSYMPDGRKLVNGQLESCTSPDEFWQETLIRGQIIHHVHKTSSTDRLNDTVGPTPPCTLGKDPIETTGKNEYYCT